MRKLENLIPPPVLLLLVGLAMWAVGKLPGHWNSAPLIHYGTTALLAIVGFAFNAAGFRTIRKAGSTIDPTRPSAASTLVTHGPFQVTRNPMYVGFVVMLLAWAAYLQSMWALPGPLLLVMYLTRFQIIPEERALSAKFGADFDGYATRVRRWL